MNEIITSADNQQVKNILNLRKSSKRKKNEMFVIEGQREIEMAVAGGYELINIFYCSELIKSGVLLNELKNVDGQNLSANIFKKISFRENPDGYLAVAKPISLTLDNIRLSRDPFVVILDGVEKPGNLGAIMRTCDAAHVDAIFISGIKTDIYNPNVIRSSLGTVFTNQIVVCGTNDIIAWLHDKHIKCFAATPAADNFYFEQKFIGASAIIIGTEHQGLGDEWLKIADEKIKIPMQGKIDSLNASVSAAILIFEALRQKLVGKNKK